MLAEHFRIAKERTKAFRYTIEAAEAALDAYAFNNAIGQLNLAQDLLPESADSETRYKLGKMMGMACGCSDRLDDAIAANRDSLKHAGDNICRAAAHYGIAENYHRKGQFDDAFRHLDRALKEVGYPRPKARWELSLTLGRVPSSSIVCHAG